MPALHHSPQLDKFLRKALRPSKAQHHASTVPSSSLKASHRSSPSNSSTLTPDLLFDAGLHDTIDGCDLSDDVNTTPIAEPIGTMRRFRSRVSRTIKAARRISAAETVLELQVVSTNVQPDRNNDTGVDKQLILRSSSPHVPDGSKETKSDNIHVGSDEQDSPSASDKHKKSDAEALVGDAGKVAEEDVLHTIEQGVMSFVEGIPALMSILDNVAQLHPFAAVVVLAFKTAYSLHVTHKGNTKKVALLQFQIGATMEVIADLAEIDPKMCNINFGRVNSRLAKLAEDTADDIKKCASALDTYVKKHVAVKVLRGSQWNDTFFKYLTLFKNRRSEIERAVQAYTGLGVLKTHQLLAETRTDVLRISEQLASTQMFMAKMLTSQEESYEKIRQQHRLSPDDVGVEILLSIRPEMGFRLDRLLSARGGDKWNAKPGLPPTYNNKEQGMDAIVSPLTHTESLDALKQAVRQSPDEAIRDNLKVFDGIFNLRQKEYQKDFERLRADLKNMEEHILGAIQAGPYRGVEDERLKTIWAEMKWHSSVKARQLIHVLVDDCRFEHDPRKTMSASLRNDLWSLQLIDGGNMSSIIEAVDEDLSGYISVAEVNQFLALRPANWSILRWLAYWAVGWHLTLSDYKEKIERLLAKMFSLRDAIHPANRCAYDEYLESSWWKVAKLTSTLECADVDDDLRAKFQQHVNAQESRIRQYLEVVRYRLDDVGVVKVMTGKGRIENNLFALYYLVLEHHFQILCVARTRALHSDELWTAQNSLQTIWEVVSSRFKHLQRVFADREYTIDDKLARYAHGMFKGHWDSIHHGLDAAQYRGLLRYVVDEGDIEDVNVRPEDVLAFPLIEESSVNEDAYKNTVEPETDFDKAANDTLRNFLGVWHIFTAYDEEIYPHRPMISVHVQSGPDSHSFRGVGTDHEGTEFTLMGVCSVSEDNPSDINAQLTIKFASRIKEHVCECAMQVGGVSLAGLWHYKDEEKLRDIFCSKLAPEILCCRPAPYKFRQNKAKALWRFACNAARDRVTRTMFSWSQLKERRDRRREFIQLYIRHMQVAGRPPKDEVTRLVALTHRITSADAKLYKSMRGYQLRSTPVHFGSRCNQCQRQIGGSRLICLECPSTPALVNLCGDTSCADADAPAGHGQKHLHNHAMLKTGRPIPALAFARELELARDAFEEQENAIAEVERENAGVRERAEEHATFQRMGMWQRESVIYEDLKAAWRRVNEGISSDEKSVLRKRADKEVKRLDALTFEERAFACVYCQARVEAMGAFWACIDCPWTTCIVCLECERKRRIVPFDWRVPSHSHTHRALGGSSDSNEGAAEHDPATHMLVKHMGAHGVKPAVPLEVRFDAMQTRMDALETKVAHVAEMCEILHMYLTGGAPHPTLKAPSTANVSVEKAARVERPARSVRSGVGPSGGGGSSGSTPSSSRPSEDQGPKGKTKDNTVAPKSQAQAKTVTTDLSTSKTNYALDPRLQAMVAMAGDMLDPQITEMIKSGRMDPKMQAALMDDPSVQAMIRSMM